MTFDLLLLGFCLIVYIYIKLSNYTRIKKENIKFENYLYSAKSCIRNQDYENGLANLRKALIYGNKDKNEAEILISDCLIQLNLWNDILSHEIFRNESVMIMSKMRSLIALNPVNHEKLTKFYSRLLKIDPESARIFTEQNSSFDPDYSMFIYEWSNANAYLKSSIVKALEIDDIPWFKPVKYVQLPKIYEKLHEVLKLDIRNHGDWDGWSTNSAKSVQTHLSNINLLLLLTNLKCINLHSQKNIKNFSILGNITSLEEINLSYTGIKDIAFISKLQNLRVLTLTDYHNLAKLDYTPIYLSNTLIVLDINGRKDLDFGAFRKDCPIRILFADDTNLRDFTELNYLSELTSLSIKNVALNSYKIKHGKLEEVYFGKIEESQKQSFSAANPNAHIRKERLLSSSRTGFYSNILQWKLDYEKMRLEISRIFEYLNSEISYPIFYDPSSVYNNDKKKPSLTKPIVLENHNTPVGKSELGFYNVLLKRWPKNIIRNYGLFLSEKYPPRVPDIIYFDVENSIYIDIEIDEPYSFMSKEPIHYDFVDTSRDYDFITNGWRIIRFKEDDVVKKPQDCLVFVEQVINYIVMADSGNRTNIEKPATLVSPRWTIEDVKDLINQDYRGRLF